MLIRRSAPLTLLACVLITGCHKDHTATAPTTTCTCDVYPFSPPCASMCERTEYVVQSVNQNNIVGKTEAPKGPEAMEERMIPISKLSPKQVQDLKPGSRIQVLSRMENGKPVITSLHVVPEPASK